MITAKFVFWCTVNNGLKININQITTNKLQKKSKDTAWLNYLVGSNT